MTALVGESGSGKSTIARTLARLYEPTRGDISYKGRSVLKDTSRKALLQYRSEVQMIFQDPFSSLNPIHSVQYILERPLHIHGKAKRGKVKQQVYDLLQRVSLTPVDEFAANSSENADGPSDDVTIVSREVQDDAPAATPDQAPGN